MSKKVWFITGASRGFGRVWAKAALARGDSVAATVRDIAALDDLVQSYGSALLPLTLDVADRSAVFSAVGEAHRHFGRLDVVLHNAGYGLFGAVEETEEAAARAQMDTNFFGALWVIQAALPLLRAQGGGHILAVSSLSGIITFPTASVYGASKWAVEGLCETLAKEVADFGIKVTLIEPGGYDTDWRGASAQHSAKLDAYTGLREKLAAAYGSRTLGDPSATADAIMQVVDAPTPPLRLLLGSTALQIVEHTYTDRLATWRQWETVSKAAQGNAS
ncbi:SDR family NAD(P)-dependent oxidoreductase [Paraburkholderia megapolitana]|uniref:NADP-dependent 3-hydroxy acid dehydrogenase YdfG n=1 Tax=Paraburkholderia megapolitana TaxID=420953 RepID=A0A1I3QAP0_9BURK|nr:SDR family NAD(P)-dependent oxidoreductase [Paraburkholderia megapolitana]QDQ81163.1 SDR family NAD(P)-dependent oxidoreductase [Paraburkholderia megapolitana]SFJ30659.1 NADP-dependent 3-hydroxy acid dehydrogenase YdfG [Paraburkholderia megapolitana]